MQDERAASRATFFRRMGVTRVASWLSPFEGDCLGVLLFEGEDPLPALLAQASAYDNTGGEPGGADSARPDDDFASWFFDNLAQFLPGEAGLADRLGMAVSTAILDSSASQHKWGEARF